MGPADPAEAQRQQGEKKPGRVIPFGKYLLDREIARGGMGLARAVLAKDQRLMSFTIGGVLTAGAQASPWSWAAVVVDATWRLGPKSYLAPTVALRFRVFRVGIELAATIPVVGSDRHDFIAGLRANFRF